MLPPSYFPQTVIRTLKARLPSVATYIICNKLKLCEKLFTPKNAEKQARQEVRGFVAGSVLLRTRPRQNVSTP